MSKILRVIFFFSLLLVDVYANNIPKLQTKNQGSVLYVQYFDGGKKFLMTYYTGIEVYDSQSLKQLYVIPIDGYWYDEKRVIVSEKFQQLFLFSDSLFFVYDLKTGKLIFSKKFASDFRSSSFYLSYTEDKVLLLGKRHGHFTPKTFQYESDWYRDEYDIATKRYTVSTAIIETQNRKTDHYGCQSGDSRWQGSDGRESFEIKKDGVVVNSVHFKFYDRNPLRCAFSLDNREIIVAGSQFVVYDINESRTQMPKILPSEPIQLSGISNDKMLLQGDNLYIGWDLKEGKELWRNFRDKTMCHHCSPNPDYVMLKHQDRAFILPSYAGSTGIFVGGTGGLIDLNMTTGRFKPLKVEYSGSLRLSDDDKRLAIGSGDGTVRVYDTDTFNIIASFKGGAGEGYIGGYARPLLFMSNDGKWIVQRGQADRTLINFFDVDNNRSTPIRLLEIFKDPTEYGSVRQYDNKGTLISIEYFYRGRVKTVSHNGRKVLIRGNVNNDIIYSVYDSDQQKIIYRINIGKEGDKNFFFSKDDQYLCQLMGKETVCQYSLLDGKELIPSKVITEVAQLSFKFKSLEEGEWIFLTEQGYFNASSKRALANLVIEDMESKRELNTKEIKKYFRPDIVSAILQNKPIKTLLKTKTSFRLDEKAEYKNQYIESLRQMYLRDGNVNILSALASPDKPEYLPDIMKAISETNETKAMDGLYRALGQYDKSLTRDFIFQRISQKHSAEEMRAVIWMIHMDKSWLKEIASMYKQNIPIYLDESYLVGILQPDYFSEYENVLWNVIERDGWIRNKDAFVFMMEKDSKRLKQSLKQYLNAYFQGNIDRKYSYNIDEVVSKMYEIDREWIVPLLLLETKKFDQEFNSRPYRKIKDPILIDPLLNRIDDNNTFNNELYFVLNDYKDTDVKMKLTEKLLKTNCLKFQYNWKKISVEKDLNITLPCIQN